jgi:FkbM family methyltransferase
MLISLIKRIKNSLLKIELGRQLVALIYNFYNKILFTKNYKIFTKDKVWFHQTSYGLLTNDFPIFKPDQYIGENYQIFFENYLPKKNDIVVELGSGTGNETLYISNLVGPKGKIVAVEPFEDVFNLLRKTIQINNLQNVSLINKAIYRSNTEIGFSSDKKNWLGGKIDTKSKKKIQTTTLNELIINQKLDKIDYCKINIEGAEKYITNSSELFFKICNNIAVECHDFLPGEENKTHSIVKEFLIQNNFKIKLSNRNKYKWDKYFIFGSK